MYEYTCEECSRKYRGQTSRSVYERNKEQLKQWEEGDDECPLQRHSNLYHNGGPFVAEVKVLAKCYGKQVVKFRREAPEAYPETTKLSAIVRDLLQH